MTTPTPKRRWYHLTPDRLFTGLLAVQVFLLLSERLRWFALNEKKGWTVLIAVGVVGLAVLVMLLWGLVCLCLRRRFQFGVRSLLLFLVALSVPLGWFAWELQRARRQREVVDRIMGMGGRAIYDYDYHEFDAVGRLIGFPKEHFEPAWLRSLLGDDFFCDVVSVGPPGYGDDFDRHVDDDFAKLVDDDFASLLTRITGLETLFLDGAPITDGGMAHLKKLTNLRTLWLLRTQITDIGLTHVASMTKIRSLVLDDTQITDKGLKHVSGMTNLEILALNGTQITDNGLAHLKAMTNLEILALDGTQTSDSGLAHLKGMTTLEHLWLRKTQITDSGLAHLEGLKNLEWLMVGDTQVTDDGLKKLQRALPNCHISDYVPPSVYVPYP